MLDISEEAAVAANPAALVALHRRKAAGRPMSPALRAEARDDVRAYPRTSAATRAAEALFLVAISPEFAVQR